MLRESPGWFRFAAIDQDVTRLFMDGQSRGALGMAKLLTGHAYERQAIFRYCPPVPRNFFKLDDTTKIRELKGMGAAAARSDRPQIEPVFLTAPAQKFEPIYTIKEVTP